MLIKCPECGKEISSKAGKCPYCGCPIKEVEDKVIEGEVVDAAPRKQSKVSDQTLIEQYEKELLVLRKRRKTMITWGIVASAIAIIGIIVFSVLLALAIAKDAPNASGDPNIPARLTAIIVIYYLLIILFAFVIVGGQALIIVGAVPNSIKITKRQNLIRKIRGY